VNRTAGNVAALGFVSLVLAFLFLPVVIVVLFSFNDASSTSLPFRGFSFRWYEAAFENDLFVDSLKNSVVVALSAAAFTGTVGAAASFALTKHRSRFLDAFSVFVTTPLILPGLFVGVALLAFFDRVNLDRSLLTVIIGHALITLPFVVLIVNARLMGFDRSIEDAARDLGATAWQTFRKITFPLVAPAIVGSMLVVLAWSFDEFIITFFTKGAGGTLPIMIWGMLRRGIDPSVNAIASVILLTTVTVTALGVRFLGVRGVTR
jgi:ABC-type spermidine/putrescine transport system permease subunit II